MTLNVHYSNWKDVLDRQAQWWETDQPTRPLFRLTCPSGVADVPKWDRWDIPRQPEKHVEHVQRYIAHLQGTKFMGDAFPHFYPNFAPGVPATSIHGMLEIGDSTAWVEKATAWEDLQDIKFSADDYWWRMCWNTFDAALEEGLVTVMPDLSGIVDVAAAVRGTQNFLMDFMDSPTQVRHLIKNVRHLWFEWFDRYVDRMFEMYGGMANRWGFFARGRHFPLQCDFSVMLSPKMFEDFVLPDLHATCERLDYAVYHLDGAEQFAHLDMILSVDKIRAIQWVPGAGNPGTADKCWMDLYRKVQAAGKGLVLAARLETAQYWLDNLEPGLFHLMIHARDDAEAAEATKLMAKYV